MNYSDCTPNRPVYLHPLAGGPHSGLVYTIHRKTTVPGYPGQPPLQMVWLNEKIGVVAPSQLSPATLSDSSDMSAPSD